jgi:hypothetical protein
MMRATTRRAGLIVLLVGLMGGLFFFGRSPSTKAAVATPESITPGPTQTSQRPSFAASPSQVSDGADAGPAEAPTRRQVELAFTTPTPTSDGGPRAVRAMGPPKPPLDKRAAPGARAPQELEILGYAFEALEEDVRECLSQWEALDAGATGEVMLIFELDSKGLQKTRLESAADVPFGPRSCISNAVYGLDWSNVVTEPAQVSQRFDLGAPDGG